MINTIPIDILKIINNYVCMIKNKNKFDKVMKELIIKKEKYYDWIVDNKVIDFKFYIYMLVKPCEMCDNCYDKKFCRYRLPLYSVRELYIKRHLDDYGRDINYFNNLWDLKFSNNNIQ